MPACTRLKSRRASGRAHSPGRESRHARNPCPRPGRTGLQPDRPSSIHQRTNPEEIRRPERPPSPGRPRAHPGRPGKNPRHQREGKYPVAIPEPRRLRPRNDNALRQIIQEALITESFVIQRITSQSAADAKNSSKYLSATLEHRSNRGL